MRHQILFFLVIFICQYQFAHTQTSPSTSWWNPAEQNYHAIEGQGWPVDSDFEYTRLPRVAEKTVRDAVWNLSRHTAGLLIRFRSNSEKISVRYQVGGNFEMPHMPATGVSGVDLYAKNSNGEWLWCRGRFTFGDTLYYEFDGINPSDAFHELGREYQLYLPLYNSVEWMEIGVPDHSTFEVKPLRKEKPIIVYGTSIAQGGCASRPGMAWPAVLGRRLDNPVINLGFSGNGRLESEVIDLINEIDAKVFILDCLPNLTPGKDRSLEEVRQLIIDAVKRLRAKHADTPILLTEHAGYSDGTLNISRYETYTQLNAVLRESYASLLSQGITKIYLLPNNKIGLDSDSFVDGTHPTDLGMVQYADAYEQCIRKILDEPIGINTTTVPVTQMREPGNYIWEDRHEQLLSMNKTDPPKICFFGNSITHFWGGLPAGPKVNGGDTWDVNFGDLGVRNFGFGWDRIENVLWRIYHEELDGFNAEQIILMLGTNNLHLNTDEEIIEGLDLLVDGIKIRQPKAKITLVGIFPRREQESRVQLLNLKIAQLAGINNIHYINIGEKLLNEDGEIDESLFSDGLHPNEKGYSLLGPTLRKYLIRN